ncbi:WXG100 family type VII secretion target [Solihabitans fulvus]|uniref:WXG100 family type VII secretion target n=1 Tax=Solihabitans fulvus TaxID=1892852 RepID=UPI001661F1B8|nr:hypothetical protein [Solihabitans fulvus]
MSIPYNLLPIEMHVAMISAELPNASVLADAARMWTEVRGWVEAAHTELNSRASTLSQGWNDDAGRALDEKVQRSLAELKTWGERIDGSNVVQTLTTMSTAIPEAHAEVTALHESYQAAMAVPFGLGVPAAIAIQQLSGTRMTALGAQFDGSMLSVCAAAGAATPADLVPGLDNIKAPTAAELAKSAESATSALSALQSLGSSLTGGGSGSTPDLSSLSPDLTGGLGSTGSGASLPDLTSAGGPSLAGLAPNTLMPGQLPGLESMSGGLSGGLPGSGAPPVPLGALGGLGGLTGTGGVPSLMRPSGARRAAGSAAEIQPGAANSAASKGTAGGMPMMPHAGRGAAGTIRPSSTEHPTGRSGSGRRRAAETDGVAATLRGRSGTGDHGGFTMPRDRHAPETEFGSVELLDEELWEATPGSPGHGG